MCRSILSFCAATLCLLISSADVNAVTYTLSCGFGNPPSASSCNNNLISGATGTSATPGSFASEIISQSVLNRIKAEGFTSAGALGVRSSSETGTILGTPAIATASGSLLLDDVIFSSPDSDPILVTLKLNVSGDLFLNGSYAQVSKVIVGGILNGTAFTGEFRRTNTDAPHSLSISEVKSGLLSGIVAVDGFFDTTATTASISVPVNVPVSLKLSLDVLASSGGSNVATYGFSRARMLDTLSFATSGDVFTLPAGFTGTVNSVDGAITDNSYVIPEPTTAVLLVGLSATGLLTRRGRCVI